MQSCNHCVKSVCIRSSYLVQMRENADQNNSEYGHFLRSEIFLSSTQVAPNFVMAILL